MKHLLIRFFILFTLSVSLVTASASSIYNCKKEGAITINDLSSIVSQPLKIGPVLKTQEPRAFDVSIYKGKSVVFLVSAYWCGYCKYDILKTMEWRTYIGWPKDDVKVVHMVVASRKQDLNQAEVFLNNPVFQNIQLSLEGTDHYYSGAVDFSGFKEMKTSQGDLLFPDLRGTPYAIIFDRDGVARFRGHYTGITDDYSSDYNQHYNFIGEVASGQCQGQ